MKWPWASPSQTHPSTNELETRLRNVVEELERATLDLRSAVEKVRDDEKG